MKIIEKIGNLKAYTDGQTGNDEYTIVILNGSDENYRSIISASTEAAAVEIAMRTLDYYTEEYIYIHIEDVQQKTRNTYHTVDKKEWFCRVDDTRFFKHFSKPESDFIRDKHGNRIIDR